jgi:hypothetical protein
VSEPVQAMSEAGTQPSGRRALAGAGSRYVGLLPALTLVAALFALWLHASGPLSEAAYTWFRPFKLLKDAFERRYAAVFLGCGFAFGVLARSAGERPYITRAWTGISTPDKIRVGAVALLVAAADYLVFPKHGGLDHVCAALAGAAVAHPRSFRSAHGRSLRSALLEACLTLFAFATVSYFFTVVKAHLFLVRPPQDALIVDWERALSGGPLHASIAHWAAGRPEFIWLCDQIYYYLFDHMAIVSVFLTGLGRHELRHRYVSALCVCYLLGAGAYYVVPALGPAFYDPGSFAYVRELGLQTHFYHTFLFDHTQAAVEGRLGELPTYAFLAAMPSLHMAHEFVMLWYSRASRVFALLTVAFTALTYASVLVLGWHYASDVVGSIVLAGVSIWIVERAGVPWFPTFGVGGRRS